MDIFNMPQNGPQTEFRAEQPAKALVNTRCKDIRAMARNTLKGKWLEAVLVFIMTELIVSGPSYVLYKWTDSGFLSLLLSVYGYFVAGATNFGISRYFIRTFRMQGSTVSDLYSGFQSIFSAMVLYLVIMIRTMLWTMLFVIPGIVASYKYSQAFYYLSENPDATPGQCIAYSKMIMSGNKAKLFELDLSFIGWLLLASVPSAAVEALYQGEVEAIIASFPGLETLYENEAVFLEFMQAIQDFRHSHPLFIAAGIFLIFVRVYMEVSHAAFYDLAGGRLVVQNE